MYSISLDNKETNFLPGDEVRGRITPDEGVRPEKPVKVNLAWRTHGKGTTDDKVVASVELQPNAVIDGGRFKLTIPEDGPYSFSGNLISLAWRVEVDKGKQKHSSAAIAISVTPAGKEVVIRQIPDELKLRAAIRQV